MSEIILEPFHIKKHLIVSDRSSATSLMLNSDAYCITAGPYPGTLHDESWVYIPIYGQEKLTVGQIRNEHMMISKLALRFLEALQDIVEICKLHHCPSWHSIPCCREGSFYSQLPTDL